MAEAAYHLISWGRHLLTARRSAGSVLVFVGLTGANVAKALSFLLLGLTISGCAVGRRIAASERSQSYAHCQPYADAPSARSAANPGRCVSVERAISQAARRSVGQRGKEGLNSDSSLKPD